jgi:hypothetical protein
MVRSIFDRPTQTRARSRTEVGASATLSSGTLVIAILMSTAAAITAPLLSGRRLQSTDIPSTLRVVE